MSDSESDFFENSDVPDHIMEPNVEITESELQELDGDDEMSLSILTETIQELPDLEGTNESYPDNSEMPPNVSSDILMRITENY